MEYVGFQNHISYRINWIYNELIRILLSFVSYDTIVVENTTDIGEDSER